MDVRGKEMHDCKDAGVRATQDAKAEEQLPRVRVALKFHGLRDHPSSLPSPPRGEETLVGQ